MSFGDSQYEKIIFCNTVAIAGSAGDGERGGNDRHHERGDHA